MAARTPAKKTRTTRTKADVEREFEAISGQLELQEPLDPKALQVAHARSQETGRAVAGVSVEDVVQNTASLGLQISRALSDVTEKLVEKVNELQTVTEAVNLQKEELEHLHKLDIAATAIAMLVQEHASKSAELTYEIDRARAAWTLEQAERERRKNEDDAALKMTRLREREEYEYKKQQERARTEDEFQQKMLLQKRTNDEKQREVENNWAEREATLNAREAEFESLRQQSAGFEARLRSEVDKAVAAATAALKMEVETEHRLRIKDMETEKRIADAHIKSLEGSTQAQQEQVVRLQLQLDAAKQQVQDIALKAIDGASKRDALDQVMQVTRERDVSAARAKS